MGGVFLATLSLSTIFLLSLFLSILPSTNKGKAADNTNTTLGSNDTGKATLNNLTLDISDKVTSPDKSNRITEVTLNNETLKEATDDNGYHNILNNNTVNYSINYTVTTPGTITIVFTLPANNHIDESSISSSSGCTTGSKLQKATVNGNTSYVNNQAICIVDTTAIGKISWLIRANPWGANKEKITPQIQIGQTEQLVTESIDNTVVLISKPYYNLQMQWQTNNKYDDSYDLSATINAIYFYRSNSSVYGPSNVLGIEPIATNSAIVEIDMSDMPAGWDIYKLNSSYMSTQKVDDNKLLVTLIDKYCTASYWCPSQNSMSDGGVGLDLKIPLSSLTKEPATYRATVIKATATSLSGVKYLATPSYPNGSFKLSQPQNSLSGFVLFRAKSFSGDSYSNSQYWNFYLGESFAVDNYINASIPGKTEVTNLNYCQTWNSHYTAIVNSVDVYKTNTSSVVEYGVIDDVSSDGVPNATQSACGVVGDSKTNQSFFASLDDAKKYAASKGLMVNAWRLNISKINTNITNDRLARSYFRVIGADNKSHKLNAFSLSVDDIDTIVGSTSGGGVYSGIMSTSMSATSTNLTPNSETHIEVIPISYGKDSNVTATITLPKYISPKVDSFKVGDKMLIEGSDYSITANQTDGSTKIVVNLGTIGEDPDIDNDGLPIAKEKIEHTPIEFDILVDPEVTAPTTLKITAKVAGVGVAWGAVPSDDGFGGTSLTLSIATQKSFTYSLSSSASAISLDDNLTYTYNTSNNLDEDITNLDEISVLPYNNDSRGTIGLIDKDGDGNANAPYVMDSYTVSSIKTKSSDMELYYTTDTKARDYEANKGDTEAGKAELNKLANDNSITWTKYDPTSNNNKGNLPTESEQQTKPITAIRWKKAVMSSGDKDYIRITLTNINMENPTADIPSNLSNDITYLSTDQTGKIYHQSKTTTTYTGEQIGLSMANPDITVNLNPNEAKTDITQTLNYTVNTKNGYTLSLSDNDTNNNLTISNSTDTNKVIPSKPTKPVAGTPTWAVKLPTTTTTNTTNADTTNWYAIPTTNQSPLQLQKSTARTKLQSTYITTFGISTGYNLQAGTYTNQVTYTLTAGM